MRRLYLRTAIYLRYGDQKNMNKNTNDNNPPSPLFEKGARGGFVVSCLVILFAAYGCATADNYSKGMQDGGMLTVKEVEKGAIKNSPYAEPYKYIWAPQ